MILIDNLFSIDNLFFCQYCILYTVITARKRSLRRLCFHRYLSVHMGRGSGPLHAGIHTPSGRHPLGRHNLLGRHPPGRHPPRIRSTSGRYASHWNAILFKIFFTIFITSTFSRNVGSVCSASGDEAQGTVEEGRNH